MKIYFRGLNACVQRKSDITRYKEFLEENGHEMVSSAEAAEVVLLWTCAFRKDYRDNSLKTIDKHQAAQREVVVCGCLPSIDPQGLAEHFSGRAFQWRDQDEAMTELFGKAGIPLSDVERVMSEKSITGDIEIYKKAHPEKKVFYCDQFLKLFVSEGCMCDCTYCAEKQAFPAYRSEPIDKLVATYREVREKTLQNKVILWADSLGDYGNDIDTSLPELIHALLKVSDDTLVGLASLNPMHFLPHFDELMELVKSGRIFHLEICIQSANDRVLSLMKREYCKADIAKIFGALKDAGFKECETDVIVGFPTETEEEFRETVDFIVEYQPKYVMISGYMETPGAESSQIEGKVAGDEIIGRAIAFREAIAPHGVLFNHDNSLSQQERFSKELLDL